MSAHISDVPGIVWPAVPRGKRTWRMLVLQHQLNESQWFAPETLLARQLVQLEQVLNHAYGELPFYRERLESVGYAPGERLTAETEDPVVLAIVVPVGAGNAITDEAGQLLMVRRFQRVDISQL